MSPVRSLPGVVFSLAFSCSAFGQSYVIGAIAGGAPRPANPSASSSIGSPVGLTADAAGNLYFASLNCVFKLDRNGVLTRIAGNYTAGYSGDGGPATSAQLSSAGPAPDVVPVTDIGLAVDSSGNVYIPDTATNRVRKVSTNGIITTLAGTGESGDSGDGGPSTAAELNHPAHLAIDTGGNLYISEILGQRVRMVSPSGTIVTAAGGGSYGPPVEGGPAVGAYLGAPAGLAIDNARNLYIADSNTNLVRKVSPSGTIATVAGTGVYGYSGDGGPATSAQLGVPVDLAVDGAGNLYICESGSFHVREVSPGGTIVTVAGNGSWGYSGDGGQATSASVAPEGIAVDSGGNLYVADFGANRIRRISSDGVLSTVAGDGGQNYSGDGGPATSAGLSAPLVAADKTGNLYIADRGNNRIRKVTPDGIISTVAGNGSPGFSGDGGPAVNADVMPTGGLAVDKVGNLFIAGYTGLRKVSLDGTITTVAGFGGSTTPPSTPPTNFSEYDSTDIAVDSVGDLYIVSNGIQKILPDGTIVRIASNHQSMTGLTVDDSDNLYYSDTEDNITVKMSPAGQFNTVTPTAGNCDANISSFGPATDSAGNLYLADPYHFVIQRISPAGLVYTIAGNGTRGYSGDGGPAAGAQLTDPVSIATDGAGNIYVADPVNNTVRILKPVPSSPIVGAVTNGASNLAGPIAPGEIVTIYGLNLGAPQVGQCLYGASGLTDTALNGTQVFFNGTPAHLIYSSATQAATIVPYSISGSTAQVSVAYQGEASGAVTVPVAASAPAIFTADGTGKGQALAFSQSGAGYSNSAAHPAEPGDVITLFATGEGQTSPPGIDGSLASTPLPRPILPVTVTIGGQTAAPQYAGGAAGYFAGLMQIDVQIPAGVAPGNAVPVLIQVGSAVSQAGVTIAVAEN